MGTPATTLSADDPTRTSSHQSQSCNASYISRGWAGSRVAWEWALALSMYAHMMVLMQLQYIC